MECSQLGIWGRNILMAAIAAATIAAPRRAPPPLPLLLLSCCAMEEVGHGDSLSKAGGYSPTSAPVHLCTAATGARPGRLPPPHPPCYYYHREPCWYGSGVTAAETKQAKQAVAHASSHKKNDFHLKINRILLPKLFWPTVRKNCSSDREKLLKIWKNFEISTKIHQFTQCT